MLTRRSRPRRDVPVVQQAPSIPELLVQCAGRAISFAVLLPGSFVARDVAPHVVQLQALAAVAAVAIEHGKLMEHAACTQNQNSTDTSQCMS